MNNMRSIAILFTLFVTANTSFAAFGDIDTTFGTNGTTPFHTVPPTIDGYAYTSKVVRQSDGKLIVVGMMYDHTTPGSPRIYLIIKRYNVNGTQDLSYGFNGMAYANSAYGHPSSAAIQTDGKLLVGGRDGLTYPTSPATAYVWRFNSNGSYDGSFGSNGRVAVGTSTPIEYKTEGVTTVEAIKPTANASAQQILVAYNGTIKKLNSNGTINTAFGNSGSLTGVGDTFLIQNASTFSNSSIVTAHYYSNLLVVRGFNADGQSSSGVISNGMAMSFVGNFTLPTVRSIVQTSQGKLVLSTISCEVNCDISEVKYGHITSHSSNGLLEHSLVNSGRSKKVASNPDGTLVRPWGSLSTAQKLTSNLIHVTFGTNYSCLDLIIQPDSKYVCIAPNSVSRFLQ